MPKSTGRSSNPGNRNNAMENSTGKGASHWSPPSGQFHPPAAGAHKPPAPAKNESGGSSKKK